MTRLFLTACEPAALSEPGQAFHSFRESVCMDLCVRVCVCGGDFFCLCVCVPVCACVRACVLSHMLSPKHQLRDCSQLKANAGPDALPLPTSGY